jgi:DNA-binding XRE family transcriptional regulator
MSKPKQSDDLSNRRRRLGASRETMAAGLGLSLDTVKAIEDGLAADPECDRYSAWLERVEHWSTDVRTRQFKAAGQGRRFDSEVQ